MRSHKSCVYFFHHIIFLYFQYFINNYESNSSVRFEKQGYGTYADTYINTIDKDEVDGLIISIKNLLNNVLKSTQTTYTEVTYSTNSFSSLLIPSAEKQEGHPVLLSTML